jgi:hypothetical protein
MAEQPCLGHGVVTSYPPASIGSGIISPAEGRDPGLAREIPLEVAEKISMGEEAIVVEKEEEVTLRQPSPEVAGVIYPDFSGAIELYRKCLAIEFAEGNF